MWNVRVILNIVHIKTCYDSSYAYCSRLRAVWLFTVKKRSVVFGPRSVRAWLSNWYHVMVGIIRYVFFPYYSINFIFAFIDSISWMFIADMNFGFNFKRFVKSNKIIIEFLIRNNYYFLLSNIYFFQLSNICLKINIKILWNNISADLLCENNKIYLTNYKFILI